MGECSGYQPVSKSEFCQPSPMSLCCLADEGETSDSDSSAEQNDSDGCQYELIGVTVHTGTADGGHYYSFIRDRLNKNELGQDRWYVFILHMHYYYCYYNFYYKCHGLQCCHHHTVAGALYKI